MKTQCPKCFDIFEIPDPYLQKSIKCLNCKSEFFAIAYREPPPPQPIPEIKSDPPKKVILVKISPFDLGFQATFGVLAALLVISLVLGAISLFFMILAAIAEK